MTILTLKQLSYTYPGASQPALSNINFIIPEGQYVAVLGANGSGKSTLARCLNGLLPPQPGSVSFMGLDPSVSTDRLTIRKNLAMVFQSPPDQIVASVVEEDVAFGLENLGVSREEMLVRVRDALSLVGLWDERGRPPRFLSSGQQQRLAVAGVVAMAPRFVVFDEATSMIDPQGRKAILDILDLLSASGTTIMHITHDMSEASRAQRVLVLNNGSLVFDGSPELLFAQPQPRLDAWSLVLPQAAIAAKSTGLPIVLSESARDFGMRLAHAKQNSRTSCVHCMHVQPSTHSPEADRDAHSPDMQTAFSMEDVSFRYLAKTASERIAVRSLSMELQQGHILSLVGLTGSGKSTVLQLMAALLFPSEGKVMHFGRDVSAKTSDPRLLRMESPLSVQRPETAIFEFYAGDEVAFGPRNQGISGPALARRVRDAMNAVGLPYEQFRDRRARSLSGGEKRRLAIASVLAMEPKALLLDEPTSALDPLSRLGIMDMLIDYCRERKTSLVYATHSMEEAARADRVAVMSAGSLLRLDTPGHVFCEQWDDSFGIGRPFASEAASAAREQGLALDTCIVQLKDLAHALGATA